MEHVDRWSGPSMKISYPSFPSTSVNRSEICQYDAVQCVEVYLVEVHIYVLHVEERSSLVPQGIDYAI